MLSVYSARHTLPGRVSMCGVALQVFHGGCQFLQMDRSGIIQLHSISPERTLTFERKERIEVVARPQLCA